MPATARSPELNQQEEIDSLYAVNEPLARQAYWDYMLMRTPSDLQAGMRTKIEANLPGALPPTSAVVVDGQTVPVWAAPSGLVLQGSPARALIQNGNLVRVDLDMPLTRAMINNGQNIPLVDPRGDPAIVTPAVAVVQNHALVRASTPDPSLPATRALVDDGQSVIVRGGDGQPIFGSPGTADVQSNALAGVNLPTT